MYELLNSGLMQFFLMLKESIALDKVVIENFSIPTIPVVTSNKYNLYLLPSTSSVSVLLSLKM